MSAQTPTHPPAPVDTDESTPVSPAPSRRDGSLLPVLLLLAAACLPLARAFVGWGFTRPVLGAVLVAVGLSWALRRVGRGPLAALLVSILGWTAFVTVAFLSHTAWLGVLPTTATLEAGFQLWVHGIELIRAHPAPVYAEPALLLLTTTGVWAVAHAVDGLVGRLDAPVKAILLALLVWMVPVMVTPEEGSAATFTVPFLAAAAVLLWSSSSADLMRWGPWLSDPRTRAALATRESMATSGSLIAVIAIAAGLLLAGSLPGYDGSPWYDLQGVGGTTLTTNPIVTIKPSLVAADKGPVLQVSTPRPVYLRTTALDVYSERGEWTNAGIRGTPVGRGGGQIEADTPMARSSQLDVAVEVIDLPDAVLVPVPYQPRRLSGDVEGVLQYDQRLATIATDRDVTLQAGDRYEVRSALPDPDPEVLRTMDVPDYRELTALPPGVPPEVARLAHRIVDEADATTAFDQALAVQDHLRDWTYSLEPPQGHSGDAMLTFLDERVGYCEQYAGTMAVMLRTLGIPSRVAVGFTPGEQAGEDIYLVSNGNAHAWVEVFFPGHGWLAFEPTPREDGNVLRPSAHNLAPARTLAEQQADAEVGEEDLAMPGDRDVLSEPDRAGPDTAQPDAGQGQSPQPVDSLDDGGKGAWVLFAVLSALLVVAGLFAATRRRGANTQPPRERVLHARERVGHLGRGIGLPAVAYETDHEYLQRLTAAPGSEQPRAAATALADRAAEARYAPDVLASAATEAEDAAGLLHQHLLGALPRRRRALVRLRARLASVAAGAAGVRRRVHRTRSRERRC